MFFTIFDLETFLTGLFSEQCLEQALHPFWEKSKKLKNVLKERYSRIGTDHFKPRDHNTHREKRFN